MRCRSQVVNSKKKKRERKKESMTIILIYWHLNLHVTPLFSHWPHSVLIIWCRSIWPKTRAAVPCDLVFVFNLQFICSITSPHGSVYHVTCNEWTLVINNILLVFWSSWTSQDCIKSCGHGDNILICSQQISCKATHLLVPILELGQQRWGRVKRWCQTLALD